jgi:L-alanine-DL-glutamate epimerase-like enolase superfamily enzyme
LEWDRRPYHWRDGLPAGGSKARETLLRIEEIWQDLWRNLRTSTFGGAIDAVDVAFWDLMGKVTGQPVYRLLGGAKNRIPGYARTLTLDSITEILDLVDDCLARYPLWLRADPGVVAKMRQEVILLAH